MGGKRARAINEEAIEAFLQYEEEIAAHPAYAGMPDLRYGDGSIQWETPSNRSSGIFRFSHDKRYNWWMKKAAEVGISTDEHQWISKVAKMIHPTKLHPCKICGRVMDIRYSYLSASLIGRVKKLPFYDGSVEMDELTHILDFVSSFTDIYGSRAFDALPGLLKCAQVKEIPPIPNNPGAWSAWIEQCYIPLEPSMLGPGAMANPPDRLDGFHTYNRCCRPSADTGRWKKNLASYTTDRRAFENWSDGNWITANKLMGYISLDPRMKMERCAGEYRGGIHPRPCTADHIGPISLGFCHRPEFQFLCRKCNSAKNNRMYYSDVLHLIEAEQSGETVTTWYADAIWQMCKARVTDRESALRLSRVMRDNRSAAMTLLAEFLERHEYLFLFSLLNLEYADYEYGIISGSEQIRDQILTVRFSRKKSMLRYVEIQKARKVRVAFSSLAEYAEKKNRNGYQWENPETRGLQAYAFALLSGAGADLREKNEELISALNCRRGSGWKLEEFISTIDYRSLQNNEIYARVKSLLSSIMEITAAEIASRWDDPRYFRELADE